MLIVVVGCGSEAAPFGPDASVQPDVDAPVADARFDARDVPDVDAAVARYEDPLLFVRTRDGRKTLYVAREDGSNATPITAGETPAWQPGRTALAFEFADGDGWGIYVIRPGESAQRLTSGRMPTWSPDGRKIVFVVEDVGLMEIGVDDGATEQPLVRNEAVASAFRFQPSEFRVWLRDPAISPDGQRIAIEVWASGDLIADSVWLVDRDGTNPTQVPSDWTTWNPAWSPNSQRLATVTIDRLGIDDVVGGDRIELVRAFGIGHPSGCTWLSGGAGIAFSMRRWETDRFVSRIHSIASTGGEWPQLVPDDTTAGIYDDEDPQFAP